MFNLFVVNIYRSQLMKTMYFSHVDNYKLYRVNREVSETKTCFFYIVA